MSRPQTCARCHYYQHVDGRIGNCWHSRTATYHDRTCAHWRGAGEQLVSIAPPAAGREGAASARPIGTRIVLDTDIDTTLAARRRQINYYLDATIYDAYHALGVINDHQHEAAERIAELWHAAGLSPRVSGRYGEATGRSTDDGGLSARDNLHAVWRLLRPAEQWVVMNVLCGNPLHPSRYSTLREAFDALAANWRISDHPDSYPAG